MNRKETTQFLSDLLIKTRLNESSKYWASEVWLNYGRSGYEKRVDFMEFRPVGVTYQSDIEKGIFVCYEIKSCMGDLKSGHGMNFVGEKNYICMPMSLWKEITGIVRNHLQDEKPIPDYISKALSVGIMVPIPSSWEQIKTAGEEFENPTALDTPKIEWEYHIIQTEPRSKRRDYSMSALLFWMLRAGK